MGENIIFADEDYYGLFAEEAQEKSSSVAKRMDVNPDNVEQGLAKLVLTVIELLRRLMEKQAIRRIENGSVTENEIEDLGLTFIKLEEKIEELKEIFNLQGEELNLNLGPLGDLM